MSSLIPSNTLPSAYTSFTVLTVDPNTSSWGMTEAGITWFNSAEQQTKQWNGTNIVILG